jgi:hypothetical protein
MGEGRDVYRNLRETGIDAVNWIQLAQDRVKWRAFVNMVMNVRIP